MEHKDIFGSEHLSMPGFVAPPPLTTDESVKTLIQWFAAEAQLYDSNQTNICVFRLFKTRERKYAIFLVLTKPSESNSDVMKDVAHIGSSFQLPITDYDGLNWEQVIKKVESEFNHFTEVNKPLALKFMNAKAINLTYDNYNITKLNVK